MSVVEKLRSRVSSNLSLLISPDEWIEFIEDHPQFALCVESHLLFYDEEREQVGVDRGTTATRYYDPDDRYITSLIEFYDVEIALREEVR